MKKLLALVMIVKDEVRSIRETIESVRQHVDRYTIVDTGSTDGTQERARDTFVGIDGELVEEPFIDFSTTRNHALDLAGEKTIFTLMLSGDETLVNGEALRAFCKEHQNATGPGHGAYNLRLRFGSSTFDATRLARTSAGWRYVGVVHEVLTNPAGIVPNVRVPDASIFHKATEWNIERSRLRWKMDLKLLTEAYERNPNDTRTSFYLAQTLECLGYLKEALLLYKHRVHLGGWQEEVYESLFRVARCCGLLGYPWFEVQQCYLDAHAHSPHRAEPLYMVAKHWHERKNWPLAYLFAKRALEIPYPEQATLFVDEEVYKVKIPDLFVNAAHHLGASAV